MKDKGEDRALLSVAEAISEGKPVDWPAEQSAHHDLAKKLKQLRLLEAVASAHRAPPMVQEGEAGAGGFVESTETAVGPGEGATGREAIPISAWGHLEIRELLGQGGFADVYRAYDPSLRRDVALKLLRAVRARRDPTTARFLEEARRLARVRHPNVLVVLGAEEHEGRAGLWTDLVRGKTLERCLAEQGPLGAHEACLIGIDLCGALAAVHSAGLVHRDVKTSNVMREHGGRIVLMDFGSVSDLVDGDSSGTPETISGTPLFMAPEQLRGAAATPSTDIYSLGVVLYHLVSGHFPVEASSFSELQEKHRKGERVPLRDHRPDLPAAFVQVVERALANDPGHRYASAGAMEQALAGSLGLTEVDPGTRDARPAPQLRQRVAWISLGAAVVLAAVGLLLPPVLRPGPFSAEAALFRLGQGTEERLLQGSLVHPGDRLFLEIRAPKKFYVYVLSEDEKGDVFVQFPAGMGLKNPLAPKIQHRLPGKQDGKQLAWEVTSAGGTENLLAVASREPQRELESDLARLPRVEAGRQVAYAPVSPGSLRALRGIGGIVETDSSPAVASGNVLSGIARNLSSRAERRRGIWTWQIQLQNPGQQSP